jgi:hypothetical protein
MIITKIEQWNKILLVFLGDTTWSNIYANEAAIKMGLFHPLCGEMFSATYP